MSSTIQQIEQDALRLPQQERVELIHRLLDSVVLTPKQNVATNPTNGSGSASKNASTAQNVEADEGTNPWLELAGMFSGGPGNTAERARQILREEVDPISGFTTRR